MGRKVIDKIVADEILAVGQSLNCKGLVIVNAAKKTLRVKVYAVESKKKVLAWRDGYAKMSRVR
jgi:hypothetical protein